MFLPKNVRERVLQRMEGLKVVSEHALHEAYTREMLAELNAAKRAALALMGALDKKLKARNGEKGWVMYEAEDVKAVQEALNAWVIEVS